MFAGQGSQFVGMGKELCDKSKDSNEIFDRANEILGYDLKNICFEGPVETLTKTKYSQPAILVTSIAHLKTINEMPYAVAGLSLGEYSALICSGAIDFENGLKLLQLRAELMDEASSLVGGGMASVIGLDEETVRNILSENCDSVDIANLNCPGQVVISGLKDDIKRIIPILTEKGARKVILLDVSGPFHSKYMEPARVKLEKYINDTNFKSPKIKFYANVTGESVEDPEMIKRYLIKQVTSSVYWEKTIKNMISTGIDTFVEIGPGSVLTGLLKRINKEAKTVCY